MSAALHPAPPRPARGKRVRWLLFALLLVVGPPAGFYLYNRHAAARDLEDALAEADRTDPYWRLADLDARRRKVPGDKNSAAVVASAYRLLPRNQAWKSQEELGKVPPPARLLPHVDAMLRTDLEPLEPALAKARTLADHPEGRYPLVYSLDMIGTLLQDQQNSRAVIGVLELDLARRLEDGDLDGASVTCRAMLNTARSLGDEHFLVSQLIRMSLQTVTVRSLERALGHGQYGEDLLAGMQAAVEAEGREDLLLIALRGERAAMHELFVNVAAGKVSVAQLRALTGPTAGDTSLWERLAALFPGGPETRAHAYVVRHLTHAVEAARRPEPERYKALQALGGQIKDAKVGGRLPELADLLIPAYIKVAEAVRRNETLLACASGALAAERYRLKHRRWPESWEALVNAGFLERAPDDRYTGGPLKLRRAKDGLVVHSIAVRRVGSPDFTLDYRGDALDDLQAYDDRVVHIEFRLWDPDRRRQEPLPPRPLPEDGVAPGPP